MAEKKLADAVQESVREFVEAPRLPLILQIATAADEAPPWWTPSRDRYLRRFWKQEPFLAGAIYAICARNAALAYELEGPPRQVRRVQRLFNEAEFGAGWHHLIMKVSQDLLTQDNGAFIEVIRPARAKVGKAWWPAFKSIGPDSEPAWFALKTDGPVPVPPEAPIADSPWDLPVGLAHLDAGRCTRTGDPFYPVIYTDLKGREHKLAFWQVITLADMPSPEEEMKGVGFCGVSRLLRIAQTIRDYEIYSHEKISGRFSRAVVLTNVDAEAIQDAIDRAQARADSLGLLRYSQPVLANTLNPDARPEVATIQLASLPDGFNQDDSFRWYIAALSLAFGEHYSFFAPMTGRSLGSGKEAEVQERAARGRSSKLFMSMLAAKLNNSGVLPRSVTFRFCEVDAEEERLRDEAADRRAQTRARRIESGEITPLLARQLAADAGDLDPRYLELLGEADLTPEIVVGGSRPEVGNG